MTNDKSKEKGRFQLSISDGDCVDAIHFHRFAMVLMESAMYVWLLALAPDGDSSPVSTQPFASIVSTTHDAALGVGPNSTSGRAMMLTYPCMF